MKTAFLALTLIILSSCVKTDPFPEQRDEIYRDLQKELQVVTKDLDTETKILESLRLELSRVVPQTGQIKYANKKIRQSENRITALNQQKLYFEIKIETRKALVLSRYEESLRDGGRPWPDKEEVEAYKAIIKLNRDKNTWAKNKGTKNSVPRGTEQPTDESSGKE